MRNLFTRDHLLSLLSAPLVWAGHFLLCYMAVSLACATSADGALGVTAMIAALTLAALVLLAWIAWLNYRKWMDARRGYRPDADTQNFFSLNAMLLCAVSAVALIWVAAPAAILPPCAA